MPQIQKMVCKACTVASYSRDTYVAKYTYNHIAIKVNPTNWWHCWCNYGH